MGETTKIAWTDCTFNPWHGCTKVSEGCENCYAWASAMRHGLNLWGRSAPRQLRSAKYWDQALSWDRKAAAEGRSWRVFCGSTCDWAEDHPTANDTRPQLWEIIKRTPHLDWLLLTKRAERIRECLPANWESGWPNVWLGVTIESQHYASRADCLRQIPAIVRFVSYEPAIGPLKLDLSGVDWLIFGGESGQSHRRHDPAWARSIRDQCKTAGVAFFYKQSSGRYQGNDPYLDGQTYREYPRPRKIAWPHVPQPSRRGQMELFAC